MLRTDEPLEDNRPIRLGDATLGARRHICAFFNSTDDCYRVLLPFIQDGFAGGEKAVHIIDPRRREEHVRRLCSVGIDAAAAQQAGQLDLRDWADTHLLDGFFDPARMRGLLAGIRQRSRAQGFPRTRFVTHMEWALEDRPGVDALLEYEASANLVSSVDPVICAYDLARFRGDVIVDVMRTHPIVIIGRIIQENPFFVPPDQFLRERRGRIATNESRAVD